jgi:preprotein translocase subunit SecY
MASATEQLARQFNWGAFGKAKDLKARLLFTLGAMIIFRLGTHIPLPGVNPQMLAQIFANKSAGVLGMFDMFSGGALQRMAIFALGIMPYISASIIVQMLGAVVPSMEQMKKEGEIGRKKLNQYTRYLTVILAAVQGYFIAVGLEHMDGSAVIDPGVFFRISSVTTLVGGTMFLMWLCEQITARGIGNGTSMVIFAGIVANLPRAVAQTLELGKTGAISTAVILLIIVTSVAVIGFIVFMERAQRRILVQYPKRQVGQKIYGGESTHLPLKLNTAGVIPAIFASSLLLMPLTVIGFSGNTTTGVMATIARYIQHGQPLYMALYGALIIFFCFFYTTLVFNPKETAENLRKAGGFVPGMKPGKNTADYLSYVLTRITVLGAAYITFICLLPEFMISKFNIPFALGGTGLLIAVTVPMDTFGQIHSYLIAHQYEGLMRKTRQKGARKK